MAGIAGIFSVTRIAPANLAEEFGLLHQIGRIGYLLVPAAFTVAVLKNSRLRTNKLRLSFFAIGALFYTPVFIFSDPVSAITSCATAHGLQYLVFMASVSGSHQKSYRSVIGLLGIATIGGFALSQASAAAGWRFAPALNGLFVGVVMTHFVLDAGIWRLRELFQRGYMRGKFFFVFDR